MLSIVTAPGMHRDAVMEMDLLSIEQRLAEVLAPKHPDGPRSLPGSGVERSFRSDGVAAHLADLGE